MVWSKAWLAFIRRTSSRPCRSVSSMVFFAFGDEDDADDEEGCVVFDEGMATAAASDDSE